MQNTRSIPPVMSPLLEGEWVLTDTAERSQLGSELRVKGKEEILIAAGIDLVHVLLLLFFCILRCVYTIDDPLLKHYSNHDDPLPNNFGYVRMLIIVLSHVYMKKC